MSIGTTADDVPTLVAVGAAVAIAASLAHEALGHGVGCLADGGTVTLLTFLVFRCEGAGVLADGGGPVGAFVVAAACLTVLRLLRPKASVASLFLYALGVQAMLWVWAQMVSEGVNGSDDWGHVAADLGWTAGWHAGAIVAGVIGYVMTVRMAVPIGVGLARGLPARLLIPYVSACTFAMAFGAMWHGDRLGSALDGLLSFGAAPLGYLLAIRAIAGADDMAPHPAISRSRSLLLSVAVVATMFAVTIAQGVGRFA